MRNNYLLMHPALHLALSPTETPAHFRHMFEVAARRWPGKQLAYIGTDDDGNHYLHELGEHRELLVLTGIFHP